MLRYSAKGNNFSRMPIVVSDAILKLTTLNDVYFVCDLALDRSLYRMITDAGQRLENLNKRYKAGMKVSAESLQSAEDRFARIKIRCETFHACTARIRDDRAGVDTVAEIVAIAYYGKGYVANKEGVVSIRKAAADMSCLTTYSLLADLAFRAKEYVADPSNSSAFSALRDLLSSFLSDCVGGSFKPTVKATVNFASALADKYMQDRNHGTVFEGTLDEEMLVTLTASALLDTLGGIMDRRNK